MKRRPTSPKQVLVCLFLLWFIICSNVTGCHHDSDMGGNPNPGQVKGPTMNSNLTKNDQSILLEVQAPQTFSNIQNNDPFIDVDTTQIMQTIDGFGFTLTGGSAIAINGLGPAAKSDLLNELFVISNRSLGISYLRISIGSSDLDRSVFSYDDMPAGQIDTSLLNFSLDPDRQNLIPLLKQILVLNPNIKILAVPWSAPVWMKDNGSSVGGSLKPEYYDAYAHYFAKYIQGMKAEGITIDAIAPQNEPLNPNNNPSLYMTAQQEATFIKNNLGPTFQAQSISTKILVYDHNCDHPEYATSILADANASRFVYGSAFHLYAGDISALSTVHNAYTDKQVYFTEQYTSSTGDFGGDLKWHLKNVVIGSMRNWSKTALEWNLANDQNFGPHTPGGCTTCKGALTINFSTITRNVAYYIIAHASMFVPSGSVRIGSNIVGEVQNVAFKTPSGTKVLIAENDGSTDANFNIRFAGTWVHVTLPAGAVATYRW